jgi:hypothetical protein
MDENQKSRHLAEDTGGSGIGTWVAGAIAVLLILFLIWWLPARVASGYAVPRITGSVASLPGRLPVLWVRSWPWQTTPPKAKVVFDLANGTHVSAAAVGSAPSVGWFSGRAVPAELSLVNAPPVHANQVVGIQVEWQGGSSSAAEPAFWIAAPTGESPVPGAAVIWASELDPAARVGVELPVAKNPSVISISSPDPVLSPWLNAKCITVPSGGSDAPVRTALLHGSLPDQPQSCGHIKSGTAVVLAGTLGSSYSFYVWQPILQEVVNSHIRTLVAGKVLVASEHQMTSQNWWKFTTAPLPPGF